MTRAALRPVFLFLLTWFALATCASANETQTENANPGTTTWQLTTAALTRQIEGYASLTSVNVGGSISFLVSTNDSSYTMDFYRIGWYGGAGGREVLGPITLPGGVQPTPSPDAYGTFECNWATSYVLTVPNNWVSGVYLVKLTGSSGNQSYIQFVVREDSRNSVYLFQRSITTDQAYNNWPGTNYGGKSLYTGAVKVSFNRPYAIDESYSAAHDGAGFFPRWEINMVRWLEMNGYDVTYATNIDVHENPNLLLNHKGFLAVGHDEYWSWEMRQNVETARDAGVGLAFFSGNESYWQIRLEPSTINGAADRTQVAYKSLSDPTTNPCLMTILWRQNTCKPSEQAFVGVESTAYNVGGNIVIADPSNWALAGTGLVSGQVISGALGYEVDGVVEADSPAGTAVVAHSPLPNGYQSDSAPAPAYPFSDMATYTAAASGATVFSVGTIQWSWTLDDWGVPTTRDSKLNPAAQRITQNILARLATDGAMPPAPPSNLLAIAGNAQVGLTWSGSAGATSYNVKRSTTNGGPYTTVASPTTTSYTDTGLNNGTTYYYVVTAVNSAGESGSSNQTSATPAGVPPPIPANFVATAGNAQVTLSWTASAGATSYNVKRSTTNGGPYATVGGPVTTSYTDSELINGTTYYYVVSAVNSAGASGNSGQASATPQAPPLTISLMNAVVGGGNRGTVATSQTSSTNMNLSAGNLIVIALGFAGDQDKSTAPTDTAGNTYVECCFAQTNSVATTIWYAKNTNANASDAITVHFGSSTGFIGFVAAQYSGADTSNPLETHAIGSCTSCTWLISGSFSPASSRNLNVAAMNSSASAVYAAGLNYKNEATSPAPAPTVAMEDLTNAPSGSQTASIGSVSGGQEIVVMSVASFKAAANTTPAAPSNLVATAGNSQAVLNWSASAGATSYNVKHSTLNGGPYTTLASLSGMTYTDSGLNNGTTYYYVVTAANAAGESGNSNQAIATPALPTVWIDAPSPSANVSGMLNISGWAIDSGSAISNVQVAVDGTVVGNATYGFSRPDVCAVYPGRPGCPNVGYAYSLNTSTLSAGLHTIIISASDSDMPPDTGSATVTVNVQATPPTVWIDTPSSGATVSGFLSISGWAIDNAAAVGTAISSVQVKLDGTVVGTASYGLSRPDVCAVYPGRPGCPNVGYSYSLNTSTLSVGTHTITVTATDSDTTPDSGSSSVTVNVRATPPTVYIDAPTAGSNVSGTVTVSGWAVDNAASVGSAISSVQVKVDGTVVGTASYGLSRPDVCAVYPGRPGCPNVGYSYSLNTSTLSVGSHTITVTATDSDTTPDSGSTSISVTH